MLLASPANNIFIAGTKLVQVEDRTKFIWVLLRRSRIYLKLGHFLHFIKYSSTFTPINQEPKRP